MNTAKLRSRGEAMKELGDDILSMRVGGDSLRIIGNQLVLAAECIEQQNDIIRSLGGNYEREQSFINSRISYRGFSYGMGSQDGIDSLRNAIKLNKDD